jgi:hypothetical protein
MSATPDESPIDEAVERHAHAITDAVKELAWAIVQRDVFVNGGTADEAGKLHKVLADAFGELKKGKK